MLFSKQGEHSKKQVEHRKLTQTINDLRSEKTRMLELINRQTNMLQAFKAREENSVLQSATAAAAAAELLARLQFAETVLEQVGIDVNALRQNEQRWKTVVDLIGYRINVPAVGQGSYINQYQIDADLRYLSTVLTKLSPDEIPIKTIVNRDS